jgi:DNA-binding CsgD family transcriptional regulator
MIIRQNSGGAEAMIIDPNKHFFITSHKEVDEIIKPLKEYFDLTSFVYQKNFNDGSEIRLSNQPEWVHYFYEHELYRYSVFERPPSEFVKARIIWAGLSLHQKVLSQAREFDIDHGITFVEPCADGCEFFFIGTRRDKREVMQRYLANLDMLEQFLIYFREKARPLINQALQQKLIIPHKYETAPQTGLVKMKSFDREGFLNAISPVQFSMRELECMRLLTRGYTQKMIAKELGISPRTVETHLQHIKEKTQTYSKGDLVKYLLKLPL